LAKASPIQPSARLEKKEARVSPGFAFTTKTQRYIDATDATAPPKIGMARSAEVTPPC
jgi:hypothetical protein